MRVTPRYIVPTVLLGLVAIALFTFIGGSVVRLLWNWLLPPLFGFKLITFWQALGILALSRILFGSFHGGGGRWRRHSPEDTDRFREDIRDRFHGRTAAAAETGQGE